MVETVIFDQMSPHCGPELEDSKLIFLHDTLAHDDASLYQVWLQKVQQLKRYRPDEHSLEFSTFSVTLTVIQCVHKTIQLMMMCHQTEVSCKKISSSEDISYSHILIILAFTVTLTLKTANQSFCLHFYS